MIKKLAAYIISKILIIDILTNIRYQLFLDSVRDFRKFSSFNKLSEKIQKNGGRTFAWFILRKNKNLLKNLYRNTARGHQREAYLMLKTLLEDVAVAYDFCLNYKFNSGNKVKKPLLKKALDQLNEEISGTIMDYKVEDYLKLYGHFNRFSHFNFDEFQNQLISFVQKKPKIFDKISKVEHALICVDVYSHLQDVYFPFKEIFTQEDKNKLIYLKKISENEWNFVIPSKVSKKMLRWSKWWPIAKKLYS
ncbi:MAG: hypothetical protein KBD29_00190 [Candidatus Magasanikbacteria bacterium]|nr:hypothetical protein [Candidatus Magasanikbacteria bacterium]